MQDPIRWFINTLSGGRIFTKEEPQRWRTRAGRHDRLNIKALRKRRAKNKRARKSRQINRNKK